jgi:hypothetical protein
MSRRNVVLSGLAGLVGAILLTALCLLVVTQGWLPPLLTAMLQVWGTFFFLLFFSLIEIPMMVIAIRRLAASPNPKAKYVTLLTVTGYTCFAAVYAAPFILLTGHLWAGVALAGLAVIRFGSVILLIPKENSYAT